MGVQKMIDDWKYKKGAEKRKNAPEFKLMKCVTTNGVYKPLSKCNHLYGGCHKTMFFGDFEDSKQFFFNSYKCKLF